MKIERLLWHPFNWKWTCCIDNWRQIWVPTFFRTLCWKFMFFNSKTQGRWFNKITLLKVESSDTLHLVFYGIAAVKCLKSEAGYLVNYSKTTFLCIHYNWNWCNTVATPFFIHLELRLYCAKPYSASMKYKNKVHLPECLANINTQFLHSRKSALELMLHMISNHKNSEGEPN